MVSVHLGHKHHALHRSWEVCIYQADLHQFLIPFFPSPWPSSQTSHCLWVKVDSYFGPPLSPETVDSHGRLLQSGPPANSSLPPSFRDDPHGDLCCSGPLPGCTGISHRTFYKLGPIDFPPQSTSDIKLPVDHRCGLRRGGNVSTYLLRQFNLYSPILFLATILLERFLLCKASLWLAGQIIPSVWW